MMMNMVGIATSNLRKIWTSMRSFRRSPAPVTWASCGRPTFSIVAIHVNDAAAVESAMTDFRRVTDEFFVAPQISEADLATAAAAGFRTVLNNRPDAEEPGQLGSDAARKAAAAAGLAYETIPFSGPPPAAAVDATASLLA
jgi:hypothetical protein